MGIQTACLVSKVEGYHTNMLILTSLHCTDRPVQCSVSHPPCCTQMLTVSVINCDDDSNQFPMLTIHLSWQHLRRSAIP